MFLLKETDRASFEYWLDQWLRKWEWFLRERNEDDRFIHTRLRSAYFSLKRNLPFLFTFEEHMMNFSITNTNSLDGWFSHLKSNLSLHRVASKETLLKLISDLIFL